MSLAVFVMLLIAFANSEELEPRSISEPIDAKPANDQALNHQEEILSAKMIKARKILGDLTGPKVEELVVLAERRLYKGSIKERNITQGLHELLEMELMIERASSVNERATFPRPLPQPENEATSSLDEKRLYERSMEFVGTGVDIAVRASFDLAIFQLLVAEKDEHIPVIPSNQESNSNLQASMLRLHKASNYGSLEATLVLANRFSFGHNGAPQNEEMAVAYSRLAATRITSQVESSTSPPPLESSVTLHERWADQWHVPPTMAEGPRQRAMEDDMALRGNAAARGRVAYRMLVGARGGGDMIDPNRARAMWQLAENHGDPMGTFNLGYLALTGKAGKENHTLARKKFEQATKGKVPVSHAFLALGSMAWEGKGMGEDGGKGLPNMSLAIDYFERGLVYNCSECAFNLGVLHLHGVGSVVKANATTAYSYFKLADQLGAWKAAFTLGDLTSEGTGCDKNLTLALSFYRKFIRQKAGWHEQVNEAIEVLDEGDAFGAIFRLLLLAEQGSANAALNLAWILRRKNYDQMGLESPEYPQWLPWRGRPELRHRVASKLLKKAARGGGCIPCMVQHSQDLLQQVEFIESTAMQETEASDASISALSIGTLRSEAVFWLEQAVREGDELLSLRISGPHNTSIIEAMFVLGSLYHHGLVVEQNVTMALELYLKAFRISLKHQFPRAVAPFMGLLGLQIDRNMRFLFGSNFSHRVILWIRSRVVVPLTVGEHVMENGSWRNLVSWDVDDLLLAILLGGLGVILGIKIMHQR